MLYSFCLYSIDKNEYAILSKICIDKHVSDCGKKTIFSKLHGNAFTVLTD